MTRTNTSTAGVVAVFQSPLFIFCSLSFTLPYLLRIDPETLRTFPSTTKQPPNAKPIYSPPNGNQNIFLFFHQERNDDERKEE